MKKITVLLLLVATTSIAQIKGNETIETRTFSAENIEIVKTNLYAKITIDQSLTESLRITADSNLFKHIGKTVEDGVLHIDQLKWISPSQNIKITVGAPYLKRLEQGTHDTTRIINISNEYLQIMAPIGKVYLEGQTKELRIGAELAQIDASKLNAETAYVNLWSYGKITVNVKEKLTAEVSNDGRLFYLNEPEKLDVKTKSNGRILALKDKDQLLNPEAKYIKFKIRNNSNNRNNFFVIGPKSDGSKFSYGFPMMPNAKRNENWTVGTKVYKVNGLGFRKLLVEIINEDEGKTVDLF